MVFFHKQNKLLSIQIIVMRPLHVTHYSTAWAAIFENCVKNFLQSRNHGKDRMKKDGFHWKICKEEGTEQLRQFFKMTGISPILGQYCQTKKLFSSILKLKKYFLYAILEITSVA
ncbi:MAG: hypothetical protein Q4C66_03980 [Lachnospiraceae bacterium]|nr:hypothetical protein [Lachnospiraceae bacterium]